MVNYRLSKTAKEDLIKIYQFGAERFGESQPEKYYDSFFKYFEIIAQRPYSLENVDFIKEGYRRCVCGADTIYFKVNAEFVDIMTIIGRQDLENSLSKLK